MTIQQQVRTNETLLFCGGIFLLVLVMYARSLFNGFVLWDDNLLILENPISHGLSLSHIWQAFTTYDPDLYVPLTFISFQINYLIGGLHPFIYHLTNVLLHAGNAILVGWIIFWLSKKKSVAIFTALLFAAHPINVEAVAWASARKDVLSSFFFLLSLGLFLQWRDVKHRGWYAGGLISFLCGLLSKVSIVPLPLILVMTDWYRTRKISKDSLLATAPFFLLSVILGVVSLYGKAGGSQTMTAKLLVGFKAVVFSLWHLVWPFGYSVVYPFVGEATIGRIDLVIPLIIVLAASAAAWMLRKRFPTLSFGWAWFLLLLAPSFLTAAKGQDVVTALYLTSDRYVYLAAIGIFFVAAAGLFRIWKGPVRVKQGIVIAIVLLLGNLSALQSLVWKNTETLLRSALANYPDSAIAHNNLGAYYDSIGDSDAAAREYAAAVEGGGTSDAWFNVGVTAMREKRSEDAIAAFTRAVELRPTFVNAQLNLGGLLTNAGRIEEAVEHLLAAQKLDPVNVVVYLNLGIALEKGSDPVDAIAAYERVLTLDLENAFAKQRLEALRKK